MSIDRSILSTRFVIARIRANVQQSKQQHSSTGHPGPGRWLALVAGVLDTAESYLDEAKKTGTTEQEQLKYLQDAADAVAEAYTHIDDLRGTDFAELPSSLITPLQRWFNELGLKNSTFFRARVEANYELRWVRELAFSGFRNPASLLSAAIHDVTWPFLRVTVPAKALTLVPHLAIVAHEIGHALSREVTWDTSGLTAGLNSAEGRITARLGGFDAETKSITVSILKSWFEEMCADAFMFYLTGPAGFFSICDFSQLFGGSDGYTSTHPASGQRRAVMFKRITSSFPGSESFADVFERMTGTPFAEDINSPTLVAPVSANEIFLKVQNLPNHSVKAAAAMAELYELMPAAADIIYQQVDAYMAARAPSLQYTPNKLVFDLDTHLETMLAAIPPIEFGSSLESKQAVEFASILNIGWAAVLTKLKDLQVRPPKTGDVDSFKLECLHSLLLKAVELAEARRVWMAA